MARIASQTRRLGAGVTMFALFIATTQLGCTGAPEHNLGTALYNTAYAEGPYYRNIIVCAPSVLGIGVFWVPGIVAWAGVMTAGLPLALFMPPSGEEAYMIFAQEVGFFVADLGGLILGTPFLPFSYLASENRCFEGSKSTEPEPSDAESSSADPVE